jgi:hypothetical protein
LIRRLLTVLYLYTAVVMIVVVRMEKSDLLALFIFTQLKCTVRHLLDHLVKGNVTLFVVEPNVLLLRLHTHMFNFVAYSALV